jgi:hypothetical protein
MNEPLRLRGHGDEAYLVALALNAHMHDAVSLLIVTHAQFTEFLAPDTVKKLGGKNRAVPNPFKRVRRRRLEQFARLRIAERRRRAFVVVRLRPLHALDRIMRDGVSLTEILK